MKKINRAYLFNIIILIIIFISFCITIKIDNDSRLLKNINIDYYMNSLPYIYIILILLVILILFNLYKIMKGKK